MISNDPNDYFSVMLLLYVLVGILLAVAAAWMDLRKYGDRDNGVTFVLLAIFNVAVLVFFYTCVFFLS